MSEKNLSASTKLDITNAELIQQLFDPIVTARLITNISGVHPNLEIVSGSHTVQVIPASGELIYFHMPDDGTTNHLQGADFSIKFRHDGTIIYSEANSNFRTKYDPVTSTIFRYDRTTPSIPDQILPRHAKHEFLNQLIEAQNQILVLLNTYF